ncbi:PKD domain-containing protein, partial [Aeromicrobium duanguangcaii]|uniref:PKD domain-containing protein n=1 Tax=Aeromicrobium duanguangcaii TaxID=2968086 RepID=UPI00201704F4|nr:PKD domain-containing protein [Aeromicrobium duanguangcaii]
MAAVVGLLTALSVLSAVPAQADTAPEPETDTPETVSADPLPTAQIDGIVWTQAVAGSKVFAGGQFTSARPAGAAAGTNESPRSNLLAYNLETGVLDAGFAPQLNGRVLGSTASPDGKRLYIAGAFTSVNGVNRYRLAAFDTQTGQLITSWAPVSNSLVNDIVATNDTVYIAGQFSNVNNTARTGVAALDATTGALRSFNPTLAGGVPRAVVTSPDGSKIAVGGSFTSSNGSNRPGRGLAVFDRDGNLLPWAMNNTIRNAGENSAIYSLAADADGLYGSGYDFGGSKTDDDFEGTFRSDWDGNMVWMEDCHGDSYSVHPFKGAVYKATHSHYCGNIGEFPQLDPWHLNHSLAFSKKPSGRAITPDIWGYRSFTGQPAGKLLHWYPEWGTGSASGVGQAGWDISSGGDYLLYGGEFTRVNGVRQQGLVRFALADKAPNKAAPSVVAPEWKPTLKSVRAGQARIAWPANHDPDNAKLTYQVFRRGTSDPIHTTEASSTFWVRPAMGYVDTSARPGATEEYRVRAVDPFGNFVQTLWHPIEISTTNQTTPLADAVLNDNPVNYWPLSEPSGTSVLDWAGLNDMTTSGTVTRNQQGPQLTQSSLASRFSGSNSFAAATTAQDGPNVFSVEAWFKTSSTSGGKIVGFGDKRTGTSSSYDRHIYLGGDGSVRFGVYPGSTSAIASGSGYNDNQWHHVVGTLGPDGQAMYLDGVRIGASANTGAQAYRGYWRVGGDTVSSWPGAGNNYLNGTISDVAVYDRVLNKTDVDRHWVASGRASRIPTAPADEYGKAVFNRDPQLYWRLSDGSSNTVSDAGPDRFDGTYQQAGSNSLVRGESGALAATDNAAVRFNPSKNILGSWSNRATVVSKAQVPSPSTFAIETWFKANGSSTGKLIGFGNSNSNNANASSNYDRHVYMDPGGRVKFGVFDGSQQVLQSTDSYRDGAWHHVVAQQSASGMQLYIDGSLIDQNGVTTANPYDGYWRLGGDSGWEGNPFWAGSLDDVAVYRRPLTVNEVRSDYELGRTGQLNTAPTAAFSSEIDDMRVEFDGSGSTDLEGPIASYAWDFGDGATSTSAKPSHTYASVGEYDVTLKVTDAGGLTDQVTRRIAVVGPNAQPQAAFTVSKQDRKVTTDASASVDPDGTIESYVWDFGDGSNGTGQSAEHTYSRDGEFDITLTVTDNRGATSQTVRRVTVEIPNVAPVADFSAVAEGLRVAVDGSASADSDGSIASYAWRFG